MHVDFDGQTREGELICNAQITHEDLCYKLFTEHGFTWGGDWENVKDYQHFEKVE